MHNYRIIAIGCLLAFMAGACKKTSHFSGKVVSSDGDMPIEGATVGLYFTGDDQNGKPAFLAKDEQITNAKGEYSVEVEYKRPDDGYIIAKKEGFADMRGIGFDPGDCGEKDIVLHPLDAWLSVTFENTSSDDSQFLCNYSGEFLADKKYGFSGGIGPFPLAALSSKTMTANIPGGAEIRIRWDTEQIGNTPFKNQTNIFCPRHDTTHVHIKI
jgi:hypothetical protein